jgi:hypothetical protein
MEVGGGTCRCYKVDDEDDEKDQDNAAGDVIEILRLVFGTRTAGRNLASALIVGKDLVQLHLLLGGGGCLGYSWWGDCPASCRQGTIYDSRRRKDWDEVIDPEMKLGLELSDVEVGVDVESELEPEPG